MSSARACVRCSGTQHTPTAFLLECCSCHRAWHHPCHVPPITEAEVLRRVEADEAGSIAEGLGTWSCRRCSKKAKDGRPVGHIKPQGGPVQVSRVIIIEREQATSAAIRPADAPTRSLHPEVSRRIHSTGEQHSPAIINESTTEVPRNHVGQTDHSAIRHIDLSQHQPRATKSINATKHVSKRVLSQSNRNQHPAVHSIPPSISFAARTRPSPPQAVGDAQPEDENHAHAAGRKPQSPGTTSLSTSIRHDPSASVAPTTPTSAASNSGELGSGPASVQNLQVPSSSPSANTVVSVTSTLRHQSTSPTLRATSPPSAPSSRDKGKGPTGIPNFRALIADMRASGKLAPPPVVDWVLRPVHALESDENDADEDDEPGRMSEMEHDLADMHVDRKRDTHDIEDLYGPRVTPRLVGAVPAALRLRTPAGPRGTDRPRAEEHTVTVSLVFNWQEQCRAGVQKGERDDLDRMLANRSQRVLERTEAHIRRPLKGHAHRLDPKRRKSREDPSANFVIEGWLRSRQREDI